MFPQNTICETLNGFSCKDQSTLSAPKAFKENKNKRQYKSNIFNTYEIVKETTFTVQNIP